MGHGTVVIAVAFFMAFSFEISNLRSGTYSIAEAFFVAFASAFIFGGFWGGPGAIISAIVSADPVADAQPGGPAILVVSANTAVILVFYVALPIANAVLDWVSWIITRWLLRRPADSARSGRLALGIGTRLFFDLVFAFASLCLLALAVPNAIELSNRLFARLALPEVSWLTLLDQAVEAPFSSGFFVTGMLLTTLLPTLMHVVAGLFGVFAVWTLGGREMVALIPADGTESMPPSDQQRVAWFMIRRRLWLVPAILACLPLVAVLAYGVTFFTGPIGLFLADIALCGSSWAHGICPFEA